MKGRWKSSSRESSDHQSGQNTKCICCLTHNSAKSIEHIVSESLGNTVYLLDVHALCDECNNKFSKFERTALTRTVLAMERARLGVASKKGKPVKGRVGKYKMEGNSQFKKNFLNLYGLKKEDMREFNPENGEFKLVVPSFEKSAVATSKLLLKIGIEAIYQSQRQLYYKSNFEELRAFLLGKVNKEWPFITTEKTIGQFSNVVNGIINAKLLNNKINLSFLNSKDGILFRFKYGAVSMLINLTSRDLEWIADYLYEESGDSLAIYPEQYRKKVNDIL